MATLPKCSSCGRSIPVNSERGRCPRCLLEIALHDLENDNGKSIKSSAPDPAGRNLPHNGGDYEVLEVLGEGGMGIVYRAHQGSLNRMVALKLMRAPFADSAEFVHRFRTEAEAAACLDHPNIVPVYEVGEWEGRPYLCMRLICGQTLACRMASGHFSFSNATGARIREAQVKIAQLIETIALAVHHAHTRGILHRDLKPANILFDADGNPHVTDFGLAKILIDSSRLTRSTEVMGTPSYMAPEQAAAGSKQVTAAADIYSLGVILYELLTGVRPFVKASPAETLRAVLEDDPRHPRLVNPNADRDLSTIAIKCLQKEPSRRYASAQNLAEDLRRWLRLEPILARPPSVVMRTRRWTQRHPALAAVAATLVMFACAFVALLVSFISHSEEIRTERTRLEEWLQHLWGDTNKAYIQIGSEVRSRCYPEYDKWRAPLGGLPRKSFVFGVYAHEKPLETLHQFLAMIDYLEMVLSVNTGNDVKVTLRIFRENKVARDALLKGEVDVLRLGAGPYVEAKRENAGIQLLARQTPVAYEAVLFARRDSGITNISQIKGRRMAFGHRDSTISGYHGSAFLGANGIRRSSFAATAHFNNHEQVLLAVIEGRYDVGLAKKGMFTRFNEEHGNVLFAIVPFNCASMPWVAHPHVSEEWQDSFRKALISLRDTNVLMRLPDSAKGFTNAVDADYDSVRKETQDAEHFRNK